MKLNQLFKLLTLACFTASCTAHTSFSKRLNNMKELQQLAEDFAECKTENKPPLSPATQQLYNYARYHDLHKLWTGTAGAWTELAPYYRIASANGDYKANIRLQYLLQTGRIVSSHPKKEVIELNEQLEKILPATAYYNLYKYLQKNYGVKAGLYDELVYLRKSAELGNKNAQYELAKIIIRIEDQQTFPLRAEIEPKLLHCASIQGQADASQSLALYYQLGPKNYPLAVRTFHQGVKNGDYLSANILSLAFDKATPPTNERDFLDIKQVDKERAIRYEMISNYLFRKDYLHPTVPDLDDIVPLPPAKLPAWDGKIAFQRWFEGPSPAKPADELMQQLAEKAGLDWQTGLPLKK